MKLFISHGANRENPDWFIVEPREAPEDQVASLLAAGRTVYELNAAPWQSPHGSWLMMRPKGVVT